MLSHEDHSDLRRLAAHADRLIAFGGRQDTVACTTELPQEDMVAPSSRRASSSPGTMTESRRSPSHRRYRPALPAAKAARRRQTTLHLQWLERPQGYVSTTGHLETGHTPARPLAPGRETRRLGCSWCHQPQQPSSYCGQYQWHLFPGRHWLFFQHHPLQISFTAHRSSAQSGEWPTNSLLGQTSAHHCLRRPPFFLELPAGSCRLPYYRSQFSTALQPVGGCHS